MEEFKKVLSLKEASVISGYNQDYLGYLIRTGKLDGKKVGRNWIITHSDLKAYLETTTFSPVKNLLFSFFTTKALLVVSLLVIGGLILVLYQKTGTEVVGIDNSSVSGSARSSVGTVEIDSDLQFSEQRSF